MTLDIILIVVIAVLALLPALIGLEMANNPPTNDRAKWRYRLEFIIVAILLIGATCLQAIHSAKEQAVATGDADKRTKDIQSQYDQLQGSINSIDQFIQHPPPGLTKEQVEAVVKAQLAAFRVPAANTTTESSGLSVTPTPIPTASLSPDVQALKEQGLKEAEEIDDWIAVVSKDAPKSSGSIPQADEQVEINAYVDRLNTEWKTKFSASVDSTILNLHVQGLRLACIADTRTTEPSQILNYRKICAQKIRETALSLH
jgi:hypothetical protein